MSKPKIVMYSKDPCPYCVRAKQFFKNENLEFQEIDLTHNMDELDRIKKDLGWKTVPMILINDKLVGGYSDLKELHDSGELKNWLNPSK